MGGLFSSPSVPTAPPPPPLPPAAIPPTMANAAVGQAGAAQRAAAAAAAGKGMGGTVATGPQGDLTPAPTGKAELVGETVADNPLVKSSPLAGAKALGAI